MDKRAHLYISEGVKNKEIDCVAKKEEENFNKLFGRTPRYKFDDVIYTFEDVLIDEEDDSLYIVTEGRECVEKIILE